MFMLFTVFLPVCCKFASIVDFMAARSVSILMCAADFSQLISSASARARSERPNAQK